MEEPHEGDGGGGIVLMDDTPSTPTAAVPGYVHMFGVHIPCRTGDGSAVHAAGSTQLVVTPSVATNMETFAHALCAGGPVLLEGPPGCGKSSLLRHFAALTGAASWYLSLSPLPSLSARTRALCLRDGRRLCDDESLRSLCQSSEAQI